jgi:anti-sigma B factor antagonist
LSVSEPFEITEMSENGRWIVTPRGELDLRTAPPLEKRMLELMGSVEVVLDLSGLSFMDSSGIALMVSLSRHARQNRWRLEIRDPGPVVHRIIQLTGLDGLLAPTATR